MQCVWYEAEYQSTIVWQSDPVLIRKLQQLLLAERSLHQVLQLTLTLSTAQERRAFVHAVYGREIQFYGIKPIRLTDVRVKNVQNSTLTVHIYRDDMPNYHDNTKQNKRIPVNRNLYVAKRALRGAQYSAKDFHTSDNASEHDSLMRALLTHASLPVAQTTRLVQYYNTQP